MSKNPQMLSDQSFVAARLAGAAGKGARDLLGALLELREQLEDPGQIADGGSAPSFRHPQVLPHRQRGEDAPALRHEADAFARDRLRREPGDRLAEQADRAFARRQEADDRAHAGGLAGAVPAEQRENSPGSYFKRDAMQHVAVAVERVDP